MPYAFFLMTSLINKKIDTSQPDKILLKQGLLSLIKLFIKFIHLFLIRTIELLGNDELIGLFVLDYRASFEELVFICRDETEFG